MQLKDWAGEGNTLPSKKRECSKVCRAAQSHRAAKTRGRWDNPADFRFSFARVRSRTHRARGLRSGGEFRTVGRPDHGDSV